ncbi:hypothetical protein [Campylobacter helveticus]|uniref:DUF4115 domain-containing protein n=1 Tax=Campylobacter helveticus TaxID=28898 RepID=A0AAX2ULI1_9BACT|nr:hypothetical protein [Campylobacter helveticus]ARE81064.1 hypothetical protein CHELV3228_1495 [Campylobacter helveticus]MCR2054084.1 hypothetical protein [Campylobacter helveticus]MCR2061225.1 hypothetical protein [Campylobacter helveticus]MCR2065793.1 hypothetical protein [Campylobacter helveticus]QBL12447.1 hypothetical protein A0073_08650 [Campylobacter helveticus]
MQDYKKLQDLNLREVSANTQIEMVFLNALVEKDFKTLVRFNVRGFIKILEREYELDFTEFNEELDNYLSENQPDSLHATKTVTPPLASYSHKSSALPIVAIVLLVLVVGTGIYYFDTFKELLKSDENISNVVSLDVVKETELNLQSLENSVVVVGEENVSQNETNLSVETEENLNQDEKEVKDSNESIKSTPLSSENNTSEANQIELEETSVNSQNALKEFAVFKVNSKVWVGLINLKSGKKTSLVKDSDFNVSLSEDQLILTGATAFVLSDEEGKEKSYPAGISKRFLVQNGKITSINSAEFKRLNNGKDW